MHKSQKSITDQGVPELPSGSVKVSELPSSSGQHFEFAQRSQNDYNEIIWNEMFGESSEESFKECLMK